MPGLTDLKNVLLQAKEKKESLFFSTAATGGTASTRYIPHHYFHETPSQDTVMQTAGRT